MKFCIPENWFSNEKRACKVSNFIKEGVSALNCFELCFAFLFNFNSRVFIILQWLLLEKYF